ncbi:aldose 1-epimerase domain-containing protein [Rhizoctonia solani AG-1 IA]|uniref:Aldose 1-epimerase domain-containing protein n=1 Tax=Thanatephorus cucumeris (strain AG1-IA) TaxID=983506 RepID=L8WUV3_THACA|nr:aldose 1-epimerase domain-containing protein [Rhizoctonia solani AG-1 IA]
MSEFTPVLITLPNATAPALSAEILPYGLFVRSIYVVADGKTHVRDIVVNPFDPKENAKGRSFLNPVVGRYTNRVPAEKMTVERLGAKAEVTPIATESPTVSLHGGPKGFDIAIWEHVPVKQATLFSSSETEALPEGSAAIFRHISPDGDEGYPGKLTTEVLFAIVPPSKNQPFQLGSVLIVYRYKVEGKDGADIVTPVNLTHHWGFNLDASLTAPGEPTPDVKSQLLTIKAENTLELDSVGLATGKLSPTAGTPYEHNDTPIGQNFPSKGYDEFYLINPVAPPDAQPTRLSLSNVGGTNLVEPLLTSGPGNHPVVLRSTKTGLKLGFDSNREFEHGRVFNSGRPIRLTVRELVRRSMEDPRMERDTRRMVSVKVHCVGAIVSYYAITAGAFLEFHDPLAAWLHSYGAEPHVIDTLLHSSELGHAYVRLDVLYEKP